MPQRGFEPVFRKLALLIAISVAMGLAPGDARAQELGLTPSNVLSLWTNVNNALVAVAIVTSGGADRAQRVKATTPETFAGKTPADVLERVAEFRDKLDRLRRKAGLPATQRYQEDGGTVTPSVVFLNSGHVLDAVVQWLVKHTDRQQLVSPFYARHDFSGKTPSDVYGSVDLANRRIDIILANLSA